MTICGSGFRVWIETPSSAALTGFRRPWELTTNVWTSSLPLRCLRQGGCSACERLAEQQHNPDLIRLSGAVLMRSSITLHLSRLALLAGLTWMSDWLLDRRQSRRTLPVLIQGSTGSTLRGAHSDFDGVNLQGWRPALLQRQRANRPGRRNSRSA